MGSLESYFPGMGLEGSSFAYLDVLYFHPWHAIKHFLVVCDLPTYRQQKIITLKVMSYMVWVNK